MARSVHTATLHACAWGGEYGFAITCNSEYSEYTRLAYASGYVSKTRMVQAEMCALLSTSRALCLRGLPAVFRVRNTVQSLPWDDHRDAALHNIGLVGS